MYGSNMQEVEGVSNNHGDKVNLESTGSAEACPQHNAQMWQKEVLLPCTISSTEIKF